MNKKIKNNRQNYLIIFQIIMILINNLQKIQEILALKNIILARFRKKMTIVKFTVIYLQVIILIKIKSFLTVKVHWTMDVIQKKNRKQEKVQFKKKKKIKLMITINLILKLSIRNMKKNF